MLADAPVPGIIGHYKFNIINAIGYYVLSINQAHACTLNLGHHTLAAICEHEDYTVLKEGFKETLKEINSLIETGTITVKDTQFKVDLYLVSDYKVY